MFIKIVERDILDNFTEKFAKIKIKDGFQLIPEKQALQKIEVLSEEMIQDDYNK